MAYLKLLNGHPSPDGRSDSIGQRGPIFGPYPFFHQIGDSEIVFEDEETHSLSIVGRLVYYDDMFYGDWSVFDGPVHECDYCLQTEFEAARALLPRHEVNHQDGRIHPDALWTELVAAIRADDSASVASLASAILEWLDVGGHTPEISMRLKSQEWTPDDPLAAEIVKAACEQSRLAARRSLQSEAVDPPNGCQDSSKSAKSADLAGTGLRQSPHE